jgi:dihydrofolate reductase
MSLSADDIRQEMTAGRQDRRKRPGSTVMNRTRTIVIAFSTLDGVVEDPDGRDGTPNGGWAFRYGPEAVAGDKFRLGPLLESGSLLMGRKTWQQFSRLWPSRTDDFSAAMNRIPKLVASRSVSDLGAWQNSSLLKGDLKNVVAQHEQGLIIVGSASVVHALAEQDLIDEYRIMVFPELIGRGMKLFPAQTAPAQLRLCSADIVGPTVLMRNERTGQA